jgi:predicted  nucleic acid-binding Zn-ribbon protein
VSDQPENLVLRALAAIRQQLDRVETKQDEIIVRLGSLERDVAGLKVDFAGMQVRLDNMDRRLTRLERRLDLLPAEAG